MELEYLKQDCELTLEEGLERHYSVDPSFKQNVELAPAFYNHDIAHVLFGLSTSPQHEALADTRVAFGTNWGIRQYAKDYFNDPEAKRIVVNIMKEMGFFKSIILPFLSLGKVFRVIWDCMRMKKKWQINPSKETLQRKICDLRREYNITVIN